MAALCAFQIVCGTQADTIDRTIGDPDSSIPTHQLLQGFRYPMTAEWNPSDVCEAQMCEVTRLVKIDERQLLALHVDGFVSDVDLADLAHQSFAALFAAAHALCKQVHPDMAGYVTNMQQAVAGLLCTDYHLDWRALPSQGSLRPTELALAAGSATAIYFGRQAAYFQALFPTETGNWRLSDADVQQSGASLPFLLVRNAELEAALWSVKQPR